MAVNPVMPDSAAVETTDYGEAPPPETTEQAPAPEREPTQEALPELPELPPEPEPEPEPEDDKASEAGKELAARKHGLEGRKLKIQEQINALVRERGEVTRETERGRQERAELQREIEALRGTRERMARGEAPEARPAGPPGAEGYDGADPNDPEPVEGQFDDYAAYTKAVGRWAGRQEYRRGEYLRQQRATMAARQSWETQRQKSYSERYQAFAKANPSFEQEINRDDLLLTAPMVDVCKDSPVGPQILLHLSRHSDEVDRISALHPVLAYGEMKKLEARLEGAHSGSPQQTAQQHSKAPAPIKPVGNATSRQPDGNDIPGDEVDVDEHITRMNKRDEQLRKRGLNPRRTYGVRV